MNKDKTFKKVTEGEGYISGDYECWCINPLPFNQMNDASSDDWIDLDDERVYPDEFVPLEFEDVVSRNKGKKPKVKYRVTFEIEFLDEWDEE